MAKRFTDTGKWEKPWFRKLSPAEKSAWQYVTDRCDNVGVWDADYDLADFIIGEPIDWEGFASRCNGNVMMLENGKWWLVDFLDFQYGELNESCRPHQSYIKLLKKHGLEGYAKGIHTLKEKDKDKDKEKDKDKDRHKNTTADAEHPSFDVPMNQTRYDNLCEEHGQDLVDWAIGARIDWEASNGKKAARDYAAAAAGWIAKAKEFGKLPRLPPREKRCPECGEPYLGYMCVSCGWEQPA